MRTSIWLAELSEGSQVRERSESDDRFWTTWKFLSSVQIWSTVTPWQFHDGTKTWVTTKRRIIYCENSFTKTKKTLTHLCHDVLVEGEGDVGTTGLWFTTDGGWRLVGVAEALPLTSAGFSKTLFTSDGDADLTVRTLRGHGLTVETAGFWTTPKLKDPKDPMTTLLVMNSTLYELSPVGENKSLDQMLFIPLCKKLSRCDTGSYYSLCPTYFRQ